MLDAAFDEIQQFVQENSWFNEIEEFCNSWNVQTKVKWKDAQAYHIEVKTYITKPHTSYIIISAIYILCILFDLFYLIIFGIIYYDCVF